MRGEFSQRDCSCPHCHQAATEWFIRQEGGNTKWEGHCPECHAEWEYWQDKRDEKFNFAMELNSDEADDAN